MLHALWCISKDEGIMALFRGTIARMMFHIPMMAISMSVVEYLKPKIVRYFDEQRT